VDETVAEFRSTSTACAGRVTIASFASASSAFLPKVIGELRAAHPLVEVGVLDGDVHVIETVLAERRAAVALRPCRPEPADRSLVRRTLWREPFALLAPQGHEVLEDDPVTLERIARYPVITIGDPLTEQRLGYEAWAGLRDSRVEAFVGIVSHQPTTLAAMVRAGHGLGLLNLLAATMVRTDGLELRTIDSSLLYRDVALWWHSDQPLSRAAQAFVDLVLASERPAGTSPPEVE
jgi:DNA-binding transcriptional LysR family regulator